MKLKARMGLLNLQKTRKQIDLISILMKSSLKSNMSAKPVKTLARVMKKTKLTVTMRTLQVTWIGIYHSLQILECNIEIPSSLRSNSRFMRS